MSDELEIVGKDEKTDEREQQREQELIAEEDAETYPVAWLLRL